jgi:predicted ATPase
MNLREELARVMGGRGRLVLIGGDAGIGKTSLVRDLADGAAERGIQVLTGHCYDLTNTPPYGPWLDLFERYQPGPDQPTAPTPLARGRLERVDDRAALFADVRRFLAELATRRPAIVVLEDLHWADPASLELLRNVAAHVARWPVLLLVTYRKDELDGHHPLHQQLPAIIREGDAERVDLRPLDRTGLRALVAEQIRLGPADAERLADYLALHAEGNPFFASELIRALEGDVLVRDRDGRWSLGRLDRLVLPTLLRQVIDVRVARLAEQTRQALAIAAVMGQDVPLELWGGLAGLDEEGLLAVVEDGVQAHLVEADRDGARVHFVHALTREALYEAILPQRRRLLNRRVADALLEEPDPDPDEVAFHLEEAGDERASKWLVRAADRAHRAYAYVTASERLRKAASLLEGIPAMAATRRLLVFRRGYMLRFADPVGSIAAIEEAVALARNDGDEMFVAEALDVHGFVTCYLGRFRAGLAEMAAMHDTLMSLPLQPAAPIGIVRAVLWSRGSLTEADLDDARVRLRAAGLASADLSLRGISPRPDTPAKQQTWPSEPSRCSMKGRTRLTA